MSSVIAPGVKDRIVFQMTDQDREVLKGIRLKEGLGEDHVEIAMHHICIMQSISYIMTPPEQRATKEEEKKLLAWLKNMHLDYVQLELAPPEIVEIATKMAKPGDHPVCVSGVITDAMIHLNDSDISDRQRSQLKKLVEEIMNTCPVVRKVTQLKTRTKVEDRRAAKDREYLEAERARKKILAPITGNIDKDTNPDGKDFEKNGMSFSQALKLVREAAGLYKAETRTEVPDATGA